MVYLRKLRPWLVNSLVIVILFTEMKMRDAVIINYYFFYSHEKAIAQFITYTGDTLGSIQVGYV